MDAYSNEAIAFNDFRESLLYYDNIIPLGAMGLAFREFAKNEAETPSFDDIKKLLPPRFQSNADFCACFSDIDTVCMTILLKNINKNVSIEEQHKRIAGSPWVSDPILKRLFDSSEQEIATILENQVQKLFDEFNLHSLPVDGLPEGELFAKGNEAKNKDDFLSLSSLNLIDVKNTSVRQILNFREDKDAREKLRRFRLWAYEKYKGKSKAFIEDDIQQKLSDYNTVVKKWGFETAEKSLTFLVKSKTLIGTAATTLVAACLGQKEAAMIGTMGSVAVALGNLSLSFGKQYFAYRDIMKDNPVSYIADAKKKLEKP
jgi:hypothetical protein